MLLALLTSFTTLWGAWVFSKSLTERGAGGWLLILLPLFIVLFVWVALSFWIATAGFVRRCARTQTPAKPLRRPPRRRR